MAKAATVTPEEEKKQSEKNAPTTNKPAATDGPIKELKISDMSWKERYRFLIENITVEPMLACYIIPSVFASLATQNLNLEKACRVNLAYSKHVCDALSQRHTANFTAEEKAVQQVWSNLIGFE